MIASASVLAALLHAAALSIAPVSAPDRPGAVVGSHSISDPIDRLRIEVPKSATYVGADRFTLYENADCELHVFVDADASKRVSRFYWIQFERYLPTQPDARYNYSDNRRTNLWGSTTWVASGFGRTNRQTRAGSDREHLTALLTKAGYQLPPTMMQVRMVRLPDDPAGTGHGRRELMLIYAEGLAVTGENFEALGGEGEDTPRWKAIEPALVERAGKGFRVTAR